MCGVRLVMTRFQVRVSCVIVVDATAHVRPAYVHLWCTLVHDACY